MLIELDDLIAEDHSQDTVPLRVETWSLGWEKSKQQHMNDEGRN